MLMATLTTKETGGRAPLMTNASFSPPECAVEPEELGAFMEGTGLNGPFMADLLSSFLMHEQCGLHLYRTAIAMTNNPMLKGKYEEFGAETEEHIRIFEELIAACGGQPGYVSPTARLTEALDSKIHEATILLPDGADEATLELAILEAVVLAETKCHSDWSLIQKLAAEIPEGGIRTAFEAAVDQVEEQEDEHIRWARETWEMLIMTQARSKLVQKGMAMAEKAVSKVKDVLS
jgi:rubrerythrin